jgi:hypothetical protein
MSASSAQWGAVSTDIGNMIQRALELYEDTLHVTGAVDPPRSVLWALFTKFDPERCRKVVAAVLLRIARCDLGGSVFGRNRSLMQVLPVGLTYWCKEEGRWGGKVGDLARESSRMTHPNAVGQEACAAWAMCVTRLVCTAAVAERMQEGLGMTKLDVQHHFASYPYTMQEALVADIPLPAALVRDPAAMEVHYATACYASLL